MTVIVVTQKALEELGNEIKKQRKDKSHVVKLMEYYAKFNLVKISFLFDPKKRKWIEQCD